MSETFKYAMPAGPIWVKVESPEELPPRFLIHISTAVTRCWAEGVTHKQPATEWLAELGLRGVFAEHALQYNDPELGYTISIRFTDTPVTITDGWVWSQFLMEYKIQLIVEGTAATMNEPLYLKYLRFLGEIKPATDREADLQAQLRDIATERDWLKVTYQKKGCQRYMDDFPGVRAECARNISRGKPCHGCPDLYKATQPKPRSE
jgi:hypothetical protein